MADVNVPAVGKVNPTWLWAGGAAIAGIVIYAYIRRSDQPVGAEEGAYAPGDQWSPDAYTGAGIGAPGGESYDPNEVSTRFLAPVTNAEWTQRVVTALADMGYDMTFAASTIGKYLSGQALTAAEKILAQSGIAVMGNPPAGALPILSAPEPTTGTSDKLARPTIRHSAGDPRNTNYALSWNKVSGAAFYLLERTAPTRATVLVVGTTRRTPALKKGSRYSYHVKAISRTAGKGNSDWSNTVSFTVPR